MGAAPAIKPIPLRELIAESPLVPVAAAATIGLIVDRYFQPSIFVAVAILGSGTAGAIALARRNRRMSLVSMMLITGALAAIYHHNSRFRFPADDVGNFATADPQLIHLRGALDAEPTLTTRSPDEGLASFIRVDPTRTVLAAREILTSGGWAPISGKARLTVDGPLHDLHVGDEVEVFGWLAKPPSPGNPGERDWADHLRDQRILTEVHVRKTSDGVTRLAEGWTGTLSGWLARVRGWGQRVCQSELPRDQAAIASALLLGETAGMSTADWDKYVQTGVVHILAISGIHLFVLAAFLGVVVRIANIPRRRAAVLIGCILLGYALLTGFRPPIQRATITAVVACAAVVLRRVSLPANTYALAWLTVVALDPTEPFNMGCQLSFLYVAVLIWGIGRWRDEGDVDPLNVLIEQSRPRTVQWLRACGRQIARWYGTTFILGLAILPMVASWQNLVSLSGFVIGPPLIILAAIALIFGFLMLLAAPLGLAAPFAFVVRWDLAACERIVDLAKRLPLNHVYVPDLPAWWLWVFYGALLALLYCQPIWKRRAIVIAAGLIWLGFGFMLPGLRLPSDELRVTFLAVGHGGCTVLELPDGKTLLYDAGAMDGPEVTRLHIAPYLWARGHRHIDELFLSHADLDHFNGVAALLDRFEIGLVTCTPSFADKDLPGVRRTLALIREHDVPIRIVQSGDQLSAGEVAIDVLHPPAHGPEGNENVRSMVLRVQHRGHSILLTGDLELSGLERVAHGPGGHVDVLMAPHHGSAAANNRTLAEWARPRLVVACDSKPLKVPSGDPYGAIRAEVWVTGLEGAVTVHSHATGLVAETFRTGQRLVVRTGSE